MLAFLLYTTSMAAELTLAESLELVEHGSLEVQMARLQSEQAKLESLAMLGLLAPSIEGNASWLGFGEPLEVNLMGEAAADLDCATFEALGFGELCGSLSEPMLLREERIFDGSVQALYPITALYSIHQGYQATRKMSDIADLQISQTKKKVQLSVIELYMQALHLEQVEAFAKETESRLIHHRDNAQVFVDQGLLNAVEFQRLENAIVDAQIGASEARGGYSLLCQQLGLLVGVSVKPVPMTQKLEPGGRMTLEEHDAIRIAELQAEAALAASRAAYGELLPNVVLMAAKTKTVGQGTLTPSQQQYVGIVMTGKFNWGQQWAHAQKTQREAEMASKAARFRKEALGVEQQSSYDAWQLAEMKLQAAENRAQTAAEIRRQAELTYGQQMLTTAEFLDAEAEYLQARLGISAAESNLVILQARYQQYIDHHPFHLE
jgi:outer membrane protein TolC